MLHLNRGQADLFVDRAGLVCAGILDAVGEGSFAGGKVGRP
jgi:hypothetical protein